MAIFESLTRLFSYYLLRVSGVLYVIGKSGPHLGICPIPYFELNSIEKHILVESDELEKITLKPKSIVIKTLNYCITLKKFRELDFTKLSVNPTICHVKNDDHLDLVYNGYILEVHLEEYWILKQKDGTLYSSAIDPNSYVIYISSDDEFILCSNHRKL